MRRNSRRKSQRHVMSEINVTPMVDVMLVLLIVFMVAAPLMTVGIPVQLPRTDAKPLASSTEPIYITIQADGKLFLQESETSLDELAPKILVIARNGLDDELKIKADNSVSYGHVAEVMGKLNGAGFKKLGLLTYETPAAAGAAKLAGQN